MLARDMIDTDIEHQRQHSSVHNHVLFNFETLTFEQTIRVKTMNPPKELLGVFGCFFHSISVDQAHGTSLFGISFEH